MGRIEGVGDLDGKLHRQGWTRDSLQVGDQITVDGYAAKDGAKMASAKEVTLADGRKVLAERNVTRSLFTPIQSKLGSTGTTNFDFGATQEDNHSPPTQFSC